MQYVEKWVFFSLIVIAQVTRAVSNFWCIYTNQNEERTTSLLCYILFLIQNTPNKVCVHLIHNVENRGLEQKSYLVNNWCIEAKKPKKSVIHFFLELNSMIIMIVRQFFLHMSDDQLSSWMLKRARGHAFPRSIFFDR